MTDRPADLAPAPPDLDPGTLAAASFSRARKGFEPAEVRALLGRAADALRAWRERDDRLTERLADLERRLEQSQELDESRITSVLGEETARIVTAAREAAAEIRSKAAEDAERLLSESDAAASAAAQAMTDEAAALRDEARRLRDEASMTAEATRAEAQDHADRVRAEASAEHDRLIAAAKAVLDERSAEAESVAAGIREAAQIELDAARADGVQLRDDAREVAAAEVERARTEGRSMVEEARNLRRQMLQDLAERRRTARRQIEAARAGRDRIVESLGSAGDRLVQIISELADADDHAQRAADAAAGAVVDDIGSVVAELETGLTLGGLSLLAEEHAEETFVDVDDVDESDGSDERDGSDDVDGGVDDDLEEDVEEGADGTGWEAPAAHDEPSPGATVHDLFERIRAERGQADDEAARADDEDLDDELDEDLDDELDEDLDDEDLDDDLDGAGQQDSDETTVDELAEVVALAQSADDDGSTDDAGSTDDVDTTDDAVADAMATASVLDRRDELLVPVEKSLTRTLKRLVSDEQNDVLDRLRRIRRGRPDLDTLLPPNDDVATFSAALNEEFVAAAIAGVRFWDAESGNDDDDPLGHLDQEVLAGGLEIRVGELLELRRAHVQRALEHAESEGAELAELGDHVRAAYREWRTQSVPQLAGDLAAAGFALGEQAAAGTGTLWCWEADHGGLPCSDAEDNVLAGPVECGVAFPTGDVVPPAHPGCRCILVPARR